MLRKLARNTVAGLVGTIALKASAFVTTLVLARGLGQDGFGTYSFVGVFIFFFGFLTDLGTERVLARELGRRPDDAALLLGNAILVKLLLCALAIPLAVGVGWTMGLDPEVRYCIFLAALGLPLSLDPLLRSFFQNRFEMEIVYLVSLPASLLFLTLASVCVWQGWPVHTIFYAGLLNAVLTLSLFLSFLLPRVRPSLRPDWQVLGMLVRDAGQVGGFVLIFMLAMRLDQFLVFTLRGAEEVGYYAVAVRVTEALSVLPESLMLTVFPILASSHHSAPERFRHTYRLSFKYLAAVILPVALVLTLARADLVRVVFGARYLESATALAILAWGMFFAYSGAVYLNLFIVQALHRLMLGVSILALAVNIALNLWLVPTYGATGAAVAMVGSSFTGFVFWIFHPQTAPYMRVCLQESVRPLSGVVVAWLFVTSIGQDGWIGALVALAVYLAVLGALRGASLADLRLLRDLFGQEETRRV